MRYGLSETMGRVCLLVLSYDIFATFFFFFWGGGGG